MGVGERSTVDLVILIVAIVVGAAVLLAGAGVFVIAITHPEIDQTETIAGISSVIDILVGLLVGFIAGTTRSLISAARKPGVLDGPGSTPPAGLPGPIDP